LKNTKIYYKKIKLNKPVLLVGLPGIGSIGNLVAEDLRNELKAKKFATLYSPYFPYQIIMQKNGTFRLVSNRFYYVKGKAGGNDLIILLGDAQPLTPEGQYDVNERIVEFFKMLGGSRIYTVGGYSIGAQYVKSPRVFGLATDSETLDYLKKNGVTPTNSVGMSVLGSAGMIIAFSKKHRIKAACIMGETGLLEVDANSAKAVLEVIGKMFNIKINLSNIEELKTATEKMLRDLEEASKGMFAQHLPPSATHEENPNYIR
jgi:uncharacterized protein (TIGR00162 family)